MESQLYSSLLELYQIIFGVCLAGLAGWLKIVARDAKNAKIDLLHLQVRLAEEYATKTIVDKVEVRVIAALLDFKKDIKEELVRLFRHMEQTP